MKPGALVAGYQIEATLGSGSMGVVFRARHLATDRVVALKALHPGADPEARERFAREALAMGRLHHPHLLGVHTLIPGLSDPVLVLEYAAGGSLADRLQRGPLDLEVALEWVKDLAGGLEVAHEAGILHRDLKPENVLFDDEGRPKLADFGLARVEGEERLTATHEILGTPLYMAPEQARGASPTAAVDVYALGAVLYHCLAGQPPILPGGSLIALLQRLQEQEPPSFASLGHAVPLGVESLCRRCLSKDPALRPSAAELAEDLSRDDLRDETRSLVLPLGLALVLLASLALGLTVVLLTRQGEATGGTPTPAHSPRQSASLPEPASEQRGPRLEFARLDLGPEAVGESEAEGVLQEAQRSLAEVSSSSEEGLYRAAGESAMVLVSSRNSGLAAALRLAREGHTFGVVRLATHRAPLNPSLPLPDYARAWLRNAARQGDSEALFQLGLPNEVEHGETSLALAYRFLGVVTRPLRSPDALRRDLEKDAYGEQLSGLTTAKAWRRVWRIVRPTSNEAWRQARRHLSEDPGQAVEGYLVLFDAALLDEREVLAEELSRAAELAWTPVLRERRLVELYPLGAGPTELSPARARDQAARVLARIRWCRGLLLKLELDLEARGWGRGPGPPGWVVETIAEALRLRPGSPLASFAHFKSRLHDESEALASAALTYGRSRRDRERVRLRAALRIALVSAYRKGWTDLVTARRLMNDLPGIGSVESHWHRVVLEHVALRKGQATREQVQKFRDRFRQKLGGWKRTVLGEREKAAYVTRLDALDLRAPVRSKSSPSPTPAPN